MYRIHTSTAMLSSRGSSSSCKPATGRIRISVGTHDYYSTRSLTCTWFDDVNNVYPYEYEYRVRVPTVRCTLLVPYSCSYAFEIAAVAHVRMQKPGRPAAPAHLCGYRTGTKGPVPYLIRAVAGQVVIRIVWAIGFVLLVLSASQ
eukprot:scaffold245429_cov16-Prasinocladus_malaysianus.AAC.1